MPALVAGLTDAVLIVAIEDDHEMVGTARRTLFECVASPTAAEPDVDTALLSHGVLGQEAHPRACFGR